MTQAPSPEPKRGRPPGSFKRDPLPIYDWYSRIYHASSEQAELDAFAKRPLPVSFDAEVAWLDEPLAEAVRRIPKEDRTPQQQAELNAYCDAREAAGLKVYGPFSRRGRSRWCRIRAPVSGSARAGLVNRAAEVFQISKGTAKRRWLEFKKRPVDKLGAYLREVADLFA